MSQSPLFIPLIYHATTIRPASSDAEYHYSDWDLYYLSLAGTCALGDNGSADQQRVATAVATRDWR
jgi:hypothetical protein